MLKIIFSVSAPFQPYFLGIFLIFSLLSYHTKEHFEILFSIFLYFLKKYRNFSSIFPVTRISCTYYKKAGAYSMFSYTQLINPSVPLAFDYIPAHLTTAQIPFAPSANEERKMLDIDAATAAKALFEQASLDRISLVGVSGYRSYLSQKQLYENALKTNSTAVAAPGTSEHQSGLALDVSCPSLNFELEESFSDTKEGKWLKAHAPIHGFILRYPKRKEHITGYPFEPWHIRFVGKTLSLYLSLTGLTLEEYHGMKLTQTF